MNEHRSDILISQVIEGTAGEAEWSELSRLARDEPAIWRDLAESQRHQQVLSRTLNEAVGIAEQVALPPERLDADRQGEQTLSRRANAGAWSGWAVAAVVAIAAFANNVGMKTQESQTAGIFPTANTSPDQAFEEYLRLGRAEGKVVGELPSKVIVSQRKNPNGEGFELICLQQIVIRQFVPELYEVAGQDDQGQWMLEQYKPKPSSF